MKKHFINFIAVLFIFSFLKINISNAVFGAQATIADNTVTTGYWATPTPTPTPSPSPSSEGTSSPTPTPTESPTPVSSPTPEVGAGSVVINEIMWMGSVGNSDDEWIELRNTTGQEIDLSGWQLTKWVSGTHEDLMLAIPSGKTISANGYFLISNFNQANSAISVEPDLVDSSVVLTNNDLRIKLYKSSWMDSANLIDTADDGSGTPLAGIDGVNRQSMERNNDPTTGWHTCTDPACNDTTYWDVEGNNYGTPKSANLSENDLTSPESTPTPSSTPTAEPESSPDPSPTPTPTIEPTQPLESPTPTPEPTPVESSPTPDL